MRALHRILMVATALSLPALPALAAKPAAPETSGVSEDEIGGEAFIHMKLEFVKFTLDGKEWENHEYIDNRKTLVIRGVERSGEHTIVLSPREGGWEPYTLVLKPGDFKRTNVAQKGKTTVIAFRSKHGVDFAKAKPAEPAKPADPAK